MKDLSFFLLKNPLGSKMKKGFKNSCTGDDSTTTSNLPPQQPPPIFRSSPVYHHHHSREKSQPTLEEMILQLEIEERAARLDKSEIKHRLSCVNSSDILRSARNALNQYPRFSLDGKDAMYRSSFKMKMNIPSDAAVTANNRIQLLPTTVAGERVVWCRPGIIGKLMGLDVIPKPVKRCRNRVNPFTMKREQSNRHHHHHHQWPLPPGGWREGYNCGGNDEKEIEIKSGSCSKTGYCYMKPVIRRGDCHSPLQNRRRRFQ